MVRFVKMDQLHCDAVQYDSQGVTGTIPSGTTGTVDMLLSADALVLGGMLLTKGAKFGDHASMQVVYDHPQYGKIVVGQYVSNFYVRGDDNILGCMQLDADAPFPANLNAGLYLRCEYTSTAPVSPAEGAQDVEIALNYKLARVVI
jgi:hypothetical protein